MNCRLGPSGIRRTTATKPGILLRVLDLWCCDVLTFSFVFMIARLPVLGFGVSFCASFTNIFGFVANLAVAEDKVVVIEQGYWRHASVVAKDEAQHPETGAMVSTYLVHYKGFRAK